jgi:hypothetical protein
MQKQKKPSPASGSLSLLIEFPVSHTFVGGRCAGCNHSRRVEFKTRLCIMCLEAIAASVVASSPGRSGAADAGAASAPPMAKLANVRLARTRMVDARYMTRSPAARAHAETPPAHDPGIATDQAAEPIS